MPISVTCPECDATYRVADEAAGKAIKCKKCGARVSVPASGGDDDEPVAARGDDDAGNDEGAAPPKKKGKGKLIGIIVGALLFLTCCVCAPIGGGATWWFGFKDKGGGVVGKDKVNNNNNANAAGAILSKSETLTAADKAIQGKPAKEYKVKLEANKKYVIDLKADKRADFTKIDLKNPNHDPFLRVVDSTGKQVAMNDDFEPGVSFDSQVRFTPTQTGEYTIQATVLFAVPQGGMPFHLTVRQE